MEKRFTPNRASIRVQVVPVEIKGIAYLNETSPKKHLHFLVWDYSQSGLGIWCSEEIFKDSILELNIANPQTIKLNAKVIWCESDGKGGFRSGLKVLENDKALVQEIAKLHKSLRS